MPINPAIALIGMLLVGLASGGALAKDNEKGKGAKKGGAGVEHCPPGLKNKGCVPPGQAKKWQKGEPLPEGVDFQRVTNWKDLQLAPPPAGHFYGQVEQDVLLMTNSAKEVVEAIGALEALTKALD
ncbi:MAG: hypothetical protein NXI16_04540 [Alphaproteobacteria bacterium]|nr:hypothetical protein [Alphaproteobacteria bacterium]